MGRNMMDVATGSCRYICEDFYAAKRKIITRDYENGFRFCAKCQRGYPTNEISCVCCGITLRRHARTHKSYMKKKLMLENQRNSTQRVWSISH